jgi:hypothetical protein
MVAEGGVTIYDEEGTHGSSDDCSRYAGLLKPLMIVGSSSA